MQKENRGFIKFGITDFYPSISEDLLSRTILCARTITTIDNKVVDAIKLARKSLLCSKKGTWLKRGDNPSFLVIMGSFDGAEICEILGIYLLEKLSPLFMAQYLTE